MSSEQPNNGLSMKVVRGSFCFFNIILAILAICCMAAGIAINTGLPGDWDIPKPVMDIAENDVVASTAIFVIIGGGCLLVISGTAIVSCLCYRNFWLLTSLACLMLILALAFFAIGGVALASKELTDVPLVGADIPKALKDAVALDYCQCPDTDLDAENNCPGTDTDSNLNFVNSMSTLFNKALKCPIVLSPDTSDTMECVCWDKTADGAEGDSEITMNYDDYATKNPDCWQTTTCSIRPVPAADDTSAQEALLALCQTHAQQCYDIVEDKLVGSFTIIGFVMLGSGLVLLLAAMMGGVVAVNNKANNKAKKVHPK